MTRIRARAVDESALPTGEVGSCDRESGQAAVESALTLPLVVFLLLGTMQLFLVFQARVLAEYAVFRAVRVGSTNEAQCAPMMDAAVLALLPSFKTYLHGGDPGTELAAAFRAHGKSNNWHYDDDFQVGAGASSHLSGNIVLMDRKFSKRVRAADELDFDQPTDQPQRLTVRMVYWYPLRIPFANWVFSKFILGYEAQNPMLETQKADWAKVNLNYFDVVRDRAAAGEYVLPVVATYSMRMMSPVTDSAATCGGR